MEEIWKDIPGYEGLYQVSNFGRIKSIKKIIYGLSAWKDGRKLKERILKYGTGWKYYYTVVLSKNRKVKTYFVHRLVLISFVGYSKLQCNHKNGIKTDNRLENLEYCTPSANTKHAHSTGLIKNHCRGVRGNGAKLNDDIVYRIKWINKNMKPENGYWTKLAKSLKVNNNTISAVLHNRSWNHVKI